MNVLPYAVANSAATTAGGASLAPVLGLVRWDPNTKRVVPLNPATEYVTDPFLGGNATPTANRPELRRRVADQAMPSNSYSRRNPSKRRRCPCSSWRMSMTMSLVTGSIWSVASTIWV